MTHRVDVLPPARTSLRRIDPSSRRRIEGAILLLGQDPRPPASRKLTGRDGYRVRIGDYRILYLIKDAVLVVVVVTIGHRREVYDR